MGEQRTELIQLSRTRRVAVMSRRPSPSTAANPIDELSRGAASELCERFDWPKTWESRVARVLGRIARTFLSSDDAGEVDGEIRLYAYGLVRDGVLALSTKKALDIFERQDLRVLIRRIRAVDYLLGEFTPFYTLDELANHLDRFGMFLEQHEDVLRRTGLPFDSFRWCSWLDAHLGRLYDTRVVHPPQAATVTCPNINVTEPAYHCLQSLPHLELVCGYDG